MSREYKLTVYRHSIAVAAVAVATGSNHALSLAYSVYDARSFFYSDLQAHHHHRTTPKLRSANQRRGF